MAGVAGFERAISTAGGVAFEALDADLMLKVRPGIFVAGEMLDFDAPTGGYLLQAAFSTGVAAAQGVARFLRALYILFMKPAHFENSARASLASTPPVISTSAKGVAAAMALSSIMIWPMRFESSSIEAP